MQIPVQLCWTEGQEKYEEHSFTRLLAGSVAPCTAASILARGVAHEFGAMRSGLRIKSLHRDDP